MTKDQAVKLLLHAADSLRLVSSSDITSFEDARKLRQARALVYEVFEVVNTLPERSD